MTMVKLCGMFREEDIAAVNAARPDMCGFIIDFLRSHRSLDPAHVRELSALVSPGITRVGVFVDEDPAIIAALAEQGAIDAVQLHGSESSEYVRSLRAAIPLGVIQAFQIHGPDDIARAQASPADMVLLDAGQGAGEAFDWSLVSSITRPYILAGGLGPGNIGAAIRQLRPWGVDMSSSLETDRLKDPDKIHAAVAAVRSEDGQLA